MKYVICLLVLGTFLIPGFGQCNDALVEYAMTKSDPHALFIREFRARLPAGRLRNPLPSVRYNTYLKEGNNYVFNIVSDSLDGAAAVLQLFDRGVEVASVQEDISALSGNRMTYQVKHSGNYQVVITFRDAKPGCAVGIMSLLRERGEKADSVTGSGGTEPEVLYLNLDNQLSIETDKDKTDTVIFETDNGSIKEIGGNYFMVPVTEGFATLKVVIRTREGKIKEEARSDFLVKRLPAPSVSLYGLTGGFISVSSLQLSEGLDMVYPVEYESLGYSIQDFEVRIGEKRLVNMGKRFNQQIRQLMMEIKADDKIVIDNIHIHSPGGQVLSGSSMAFIVR